MLFRSKKVGLRGVSYGYPRWDHASGDLLDRYFITKRFTLFGIPFWQKRIAEITSISPLSIDYHTSCPLRINVINERYRRSLGRFAKSYQSRLNTRVELYRKSELEEEDFGFED